MPGKETGFRFFDLILQHAPRVCPGDDVWKLLIVFLGLLPIDLDDWIAERADLPDPEWTRPCSKVFLVRACHVTAGQFDDSLQRLEAFGMAEVRRDPGDMVSVLLRYKDWPKLPDYWKKEGGA
jgi:hypothetical protein